MLQKEFKTFLTDTLGIDQEALKEALTSEDEVKVEFKSEMIMDDETLNGLKDTVKKEAYKEGKITGVEMEAKRVKEKFGIDVEGKNFDSIMDAFSKQTLSNAKIEPDKKVKELTESLGKLQKQYQDDLGLKDNQITDLTSKIGNFKKNGELAKHIPKGLKGIENNDFLTIASTQFDFEFTEDNQFVAKKDGVVLKDKLENPLNPGVVLTDFANNKGWLNPDGGRGGTDDKGGKSRFESMQDVFKHMKDNNIDPYGEEGQKLQDEFNNK